MSYKGTVIAVNRKDGIAKTGKPYTLFSGKVDTNDRFLNFKFKDPGLQKGDIIEYEGEANGDRGFDVSRHRVVGKAEVQAEAPAAARTSAPAAGRDDYWAKKEAYDKEHTQPRIVYQNARSHAIQFLEILAGNDGLPITSATGKANKAKRYDELKDILDKLTVEFFADTTTLRLVDSIPDAGVEREVTAVALPDAEPEVPQDFEDGQGDWV